MFCDFQKVPKPFIKGSTAYVLFPNTKHNVHRFTLNLHSLKIMIVLVLTSYAMICYDDYGIIITGEWDLIFVFLRQKLFCDQFTHFSKTTEPQ